MPPHSPAYFWQDFREGEDTLELCFIAALRPSGVIAVLFSSAMIAARRLDVTLRAGANPDIGPRGRDGKRADTVERGCGLLKAVRMANGTRSFCPDWPAKPGSNCWHISRPAVSTSSATESLMHPTGLSSQHRRS